MLYPARNAPDIQRTGSGISNRLKFFDKDPINWDGYKYQDFYQSLLALKKSAQVLWNGNEGGSFNLLGTDNDNVMVFSRMRNSDKQIGTQQVLVILNLSDSAQTVNGRSPFLLRKFKNFLTGKELDIKGSYSGLLKPWEYLILEQQ